MSNESFVGSFCITMQIKGKELWVGRKEKCVYQAVALLDATMRNETELTSVQVGPWGRLPPISINPLSPVQWTISCQGRRIQLRHLTVRFNGFAQAALYPDFWFSGTTF